MSADSTHPLATKRLVIGHLTVCQGCCCASTENGRPPVPVEWLKKEWRARGLLKKIAEKHGYNIDDALVVSAALEAGCTTLYSEDLHDGQTIDGQLAIRNPFVGSSG